MSAFRRLTTVLVVLFLTSCGGDSGPADPPGGALDDVTLAVASAESFGKVYLQGLPLARGAQAIEGYSVRVLVDGADPLDLPIESDETGPYFHAPLHPLAPNQGGAARVQVVQGEATSPQRELQLDALPAAPGAYEQLVTTLRAMVQQRAEWAGTSFEALATASFAELPDEQLPLKYAQTYVEGGGGVDMQGLVANEGSYLTAEQRELLDRIIGHARLDLVVQADIDEFAGGTAPGPLPWGPGDTPGRAACIDAGPDINTAQELVDAMVLAALGDAALDPNGAGRYLEAAAIALTGLGVVPGVGGAVATVTGVAIAVWQAAAGAVRGTYPSELVDLTFDLDKAEFAEDTETPGFWSNVQLQARSQGWVADTAIVNAVLSAVAGYVSITQTTQLEAMDALRDVGMAEWNLEAQQRIEQLGGVIEFCPRNWSVDISHPDFSVAAMDQGNFAIDREAQSITPLDTGSDILRIATVPGLFAGQDRQREAAVVTRPITVFVSPAVIRVEEPGETVSITAAIRDAELTTLYWNPGPGSWNDGIGDDTNDGMTRTLATPGSADAYPFRVEVESMSRQGLRADGTPRVYDFAQIELGEPELRIAPRDSCISPGQGVQFEAHVQGLEQYDIVWSLGEFSYGTLSPGGYYQSLSQGTTNATIKAHIAGMPSVRDSTTIEARGCNCWFRGNIGGFQVSGSDVAYMASYFDLWIYTFFFQAPETEDYLIGLSLTGDANGPVPGNTGSWAVGMSFAPNSNSSAWISGLDPDGPQVLFNIEEFTTASIRGTLIGNVGQQDQEGNWTSTLPVYIDIQAGLLDGGWPCN